MPDAGAFGLLLLFCRKIERVTQKTVCVTLVARVASHNGIKRFGKSNLLHLMKKARLKRASKHNRQTRNRQLLRAVGTMGVMERHDPPILQYSITPARKSRSDPPAHRDTQIADRVASAKKPAIDLPPWNNR